MKRLFANKVRGSALVSLFLLASCKTVGNRSGLQNTPTTASEDYGWATEVFDVHCKGNFSGTPEQKVSFDKTLKALGINGPNDCETVRLKIDGGVLDLTGVNGLNLGLLVKLSPRALILRNTGITSQNLIKALTQSQHAAAKEKVDFLDLSSNEITTDPILFSKLQEFKLLKFINLSYNKITTLGDRQNINEDRTFLDIIDLAVDLSYNPLVIDQKSFKGSITSVFGHQRDGGTRYLNVSGIEKFNIDSLVGSSVSFVVATDVKSIKITPNLEPALAGSSMLTSLSFFVAQRSGFENAADVATILNAKDDWMRNAVAFYTDNAVILAGVTTGKQLTDQPDFTATCSSDISTKIDSKSRVTQVSCPGTLTTNLWGTISDPVWSRDVNDTSLMVIPSYQ